MAMAYLFDIWRVHGQEEESGAQLGYSLPSVFSGSILPLTPQVSGACGVRKVVNDKVV